MALRDFDVQIRAVLEVNLEDLNRLFHEFVSLPARDHLVETHASADILVGAIEHVTVVRPAVAVKGKPAYDALHDPQSVIVFFSSVAVYYSSRGLADRKGTAIG